MCGFIINFLKTMTRTKVSQKLIPNSNLGYPKLVLIFKIRIRFFLKKIRFLVLFMCPTKIKIIFHFILKPQSKAFHKIRKVPNSNMNHEHVSTCLMVLHIWYPPRDLEWHNTQKCACHGWDFFSHFGMNSGNLTF